MTDIPNIIWAWGCFVARSHGTGCHFTQALDYSQASELDGGDDGGSYHRYQCSATVNDVQLSVRQSTPNPSSYVASDIWYDNDTSTQQSITFAASTSTTQTYTMSITESISLGIEMSVTVGVAGVATDTSKVSLTMSVSSTQSQSTTAQHSWSVSIPVTIPAQKSNHCIAYMDTQDFTIPWTADCRISGSVAVWFDDWIDINGGSNVHHLWFVPIGYVLDAVVANNLYDTTGFRADGADVIGTISGTFSGSEGIDINARPEEQPLRPRPMTKVMVPTAVPGKTGLVAA
ncbi:MAG: hypothetical protein A2885_02385 [Sphingopyxis sp. RIFCSPHIGHO2_01_FULL_65_24]|nr:MAG: hypothetical protein A2885_02385 [Sphingopyxis sp. RIFCSPHIGHO2_01_FULL_65_24]